MDDMKITKDKVVSIIYTLKDISGSVIDSSEEDEPLVYVHGNGYLITGLENALEGKATGDKFTVQIEPKDAYGEYDEELIFEVSREQFPDDVELKEGMEFEADNGQIVSVKSVSEDKIMIDTNHPMAGKVLCFDVEVKGVRDLTEEELAMMSSSSGCGGCSGCSSSSGCGGCSGCC